MKPLYLLLIITIIFGCNRSTKTNTVAASKANRKIAIGQNKSSVPNDTTVIDPNTLGCLVTPYKHGYDNSEFAPGTFNKINYVYDSPKSGAKIIDTLSFNTSVNILKEYPEYYLVCTPKAKSGYIKKTDVYLNKMFGSVDMAFYYYLTGITKYPKSADLEENSETCENGALKIIKIGDKSNKILDTYTDSVAGGNYDIKSINQIGLQNAKSIFHITCSCMHDIETDWDLFVVDNGKKLSRLIEINGSGDGGDGEGADIYLPITLVNGKKIVLAKDGELTLDFTTAKPEIYPYPADCGIPVNQLVVVEYWTESEPEDGQPQYASDGTAISTKTITSTSYYKWDGSKLKEVKTTKGK